MPVPGLSEPWPVTLVLTVREAEMVLEAVRNHAMLASAHPTLSELVVTLDEVRGRLSRTIDKRKAEWEES